MEVHLVDGTYELFRAWFALPSSKAPDGREVGATRGVLSTLLRLCVQEGATHVACATDSVVRSFRNDLYAGYKGEMGDFGYDVGLITYYYPGDKVSGVKTPDTTEIYLGGSWKFLSLKYSHVVSQNFIGWYDYANSKKTRGSYYIDLSANYDLGDGWGILGHVGYQKVKNLDDASYTDWKLGVSKDVGFGTFTLAYTDTDAKKSMYTWTTSTSGADTEKVADGRVFLSFSKSF